MKRIFGNKKILEKYDFSLFDLQEQQIDDNLSYFEKHSSNSFNLPKDQVDELKKDIKTLQQY